MRAAGLIEFRQQLVEIEHAVAEGRVGARVVVVQRAVGIDQVDVVDLAAQALSEALVDQNPTRLMMVRGRWRMRSITSAQMPGTFVAIGL